MNGNITEYGNAWHIQIEREKMNSTLAIKVAVVVFRTDKNQIIIYEEVAAFNSRTSLLLLPPDELLHRCIGMIDFNCPVSGQFLYFSVYDLLAGIEHLMMSTKYGIIS